MGMFNTDEVIWMSLCIGISMHDDSNKVLALNSLPIDELGKGVHESGWWCQAKYEPRAGRSGIHGNQHQAPAHWALRNSVEVLTSFYTHQGQTRGEGQTAAQMHDLELKIERAPRASTRHNYEARRKPVCRIGAHDPRTTLTSIGPISTAAKLHLATFKLIANRWARGKCLWKRVVVLSEMRASKGPRTVGDEGPAPCAKPDQAPSSSEET